MKVGFTPGCLVRAVNGPGPSSPPYAPNYEKATIVRYDDEGFYIVSVVRAGQTKQLVVHEDDLELIE